VTLFFYSIRALLGGVKLEPKLLLLEKKNALICTGESRRKKL